SQCSFTARGAEKIMLNRSRWSGRALVMGFLAMTAFARPVLAQPPGIPPGLAKIDPQLIPRQSLPGQTPVVVRTVDAGSLDQIGPLVQQGGGQVKRYLRILNSLVAQVPNAALQGLANNSFVQHLSLDRSVVGALERTGATIGSTTVRQQLGY